MSLQLTLLVRSDDIRESFTSVARDFFDLLNVEHFAWKLVASYFLQGMFLSRLRNDRRASVVFIVLAYAQNLVVYCVKFLNEQTNLKMCELKIDFLVQITA